MSKTHSEPDPARFTSTINFGGDIEKYAKTFKKKNKFYIYGKPLILPFKVRMVELSEIDSIDFYEHQQILN